MIIIVTGTPGTGKTEFAKGFAEKNNITYLDGKEIIADNELGEEYDEAGDCWVVDEEKFAETCEEIIQEMKSRDESAIIDSHLSHHISSDLVDKCYVTICDITELKERLEKRGYSESKVRENLDAEIFKVCLTEAKEAGHNVEEVDTTTATKR